MTFKHCENCLDRGGCYEHGCMMEIMAEHDEVIKNEKEPEPPICHFTHMNFEMGDCDDVGNVYNWWECKHCGHIKDVNYETSPDVPKHEVEK